MEIISFSLNDTIFRFKCFLCKYLLGHH
jgi:hypothetical protein